jgi:hypothetical protein
MLGEPREIVLFDHYPKSLLYWRQRSMIFSVVAGMQENSGLDLKKTEENCIFKKILWSFSLCEAPRKRDIQRGNKGCPSSAFWLIKKGPNICSSERTDFFFATREAASVVTAS